MFFFYLNFFSRFSVAMAATRRTASLLTPLVASFGVGTKMLPSITRPYFSLGAFFVPNFHSRAFSTSPSSPSASVSVRNQLPMLLLPLPSRRDEAGCEFVIRPTSSTVGTLLSDIRQEDAAVERIHVTTVDGERVAAATEMRHLLTSGFDLHVNDVVHSISPLPSHQLPDDLDSVDLTSADEVKDLVMHLHTVLNMRPHLSHHSTELRRRIEDNRLELQELESQLDLLRKAAEKKLDRFSHFNLFLMCFQFGMFARLTWWEYSWDIMEPVTYFTTIFHSMVLVYGFSVLTRKDFLYPVAADHFYLKWLHQLCGKSQFDMERYNALKKQIHDDEATLKRIRSPLEANLWIAPPL